MNAAFGSAGERCMAAAVVAVEESVADEFTKLLTEKVNDIRIGDGLDKDVFLGPDIRENHKEKTESEPEKKVNSKKAKKVEKEK